MSNQATRLAEVLKAMDAVEFIVRQHADRAQSIFWSAGRDAILALVQPAVSEEAASEFVVILTYGDGEEMCAASASGSRTRALAEAMSYARQYVEEGPVEVFEVVRTSVAKLKRISHE